MKIADAGTGDPISYATVSLSIPVSSDTQKDSYNNHIEVARKKSVETRSDSSIVFKPYKFVLSDCQGIAEIRDVRGGTYLLRVELLGYSSLERKIEVGNTMVNLGVLKLSESIEMLATATVTEKVNPVVVKKDTVEYSTASYKTEETDMLEDLLNKLPGVEVAENGSVTVNGESVKKVTINGKPFFLDDPKMATKNLSAKIIDRIKVVEKKSDDAIFTGVDDGVRETVIDLEIKPGMLECWSGNVSGGGGHDVPPVNDASFGSGDWHFRGSATLKRFTDLSQLTVLGNGNNINNGTRTSWGAGINGAYNLCDGNMDLTAYYKYDGTRVNTESQREKTTYMDDGSNLIYDSEGTNVRTTQTHTVGAKLEHKFSKNTSIRFEPKFTFTKTESHNYTNQTTYTDPCTGEDREWTNAGFTENTSWSQNWSTRGNFVFRQRLGAPGRTVSVGLNYSVGESKSGGYKQSLTETLADDVEDAENEELEEEMVNQRYVASSNSYSINPYITYIEPLIKSSLFLQVFFSYSYSTTLSVRDTYDSSLDAITIDGNGDRHLVYNSGGETWNGAYSNSIDNAYSQFHPTASLRYQRKNWRIQLGVAFRSLTRDTETGGENYKITSPRWFPIGMFSYDFSEHSNMRLTYSAGYLTPGLGQLMPVTNNANPLNVSFSNPYLEAGFNHNLRGTFSYTNKETFTTIRANWQGSIAQDRITTASWYDSNGVQYSMPLNGPLSGNTRLVITLNTPLAGSNFSIISTTDFRYSNTTTYTGITEGDKGNELILDYYNADMGVMDYKSFHDDFFGSKATRNFFDYFISAKTETLTFTERLRFKFICDLVEVYLGGRTIMSKSWRSVSSDVSANWRNTVDISTRWTFPEGFGLRIDGSYNWYNGFTTPRDDEFPIGIGVSKNLFKSKFTIGITAYDIFNQRQSFSVTDASNYHIESRTNTFGRYIILTLTYRFGENNQR